MSVGRLAIFALSLLWLAACTSAPVQAPGPMLPKGPLHGRLDHGTFYDVRDWFSIASPYAPDDPGYPNLEVTEQYKQNISYVSFVPHLTSGEYYRVFVEDMYAENRPLGSLDDIADQIARYFQDQIVRERLEPIALVAERPWKAGATTGILRLYTERVPSELVMQDLGMAEDYTAYILVYVTLDKGKAAFIWMEWAEGCTVCAPLPPGPIATGDDPLDKALAANGRASAFMDSFHYGKD
jgi:hypothetical protein